MFNAMKTYIINFRRAKVNFRRVYRNSDYRAKKSYFYVWKADFYSELDEYNNEQMNLHVANVQVIATEKGK